MTGYIEEGKSMGKAVIFDLDGTLLNTSLIFILHFCKKIKTFC